MLPAQTRERSLCLLNWENLDSTFQPWNTISDAQFHPDVRDLYCHANVNPIQSIQTEYLPPFISYLWPLAHRDAHVWAVDHPPVRETAPIRFVVKYDLLIWNRFYRSATTHPTLNSDIVYPKVLILAPDWLTCENTYKHLTNVNTDVLRKVLICCVYEGQNIESELYRKLLTHGCDILISTPTIVADLIQRRHIHFEQLQMIVYDQLDLLVQTIKPMDEILDLLQLHTTNSKTSPQHLFFSRIVNAKTKEFVLKQFSSNENYFYLSSSMMETLIYQNSLLYCEPCRNWFERKSIIKDTLDLAYHRQKKVLMCAYQTRRLAIMQSILNDLSIQSILIHSQLHHEEIEQYIHEWQTITDRPLVLLIQDDILNDVSIDNTDIIIHLDVQRLVWYQLYNQRMKFIYKYLSHRQTVDPLVHKQTLTSVKSIENLYQSNPSLSMPLVVILWPGDCAQVTYDLIDYINNSDCYLHPLIERLAKNNCYESLQAKINVEFCPTLKIFGECSSQKKLKRCPYRHHFHYDVDFIEQSVDQTNENALSSSFELCLPNKGEIELRITHVSDGNRLWANILRSRNDINQTLTKIFDYQSFYHQIEQAFERVKNRPLSEIIPGEIYFYSDEKKLTHRVYVHEQEQTYFDIRRADAILNRLLKASNTVTVVNDNQQAKPFDKQNSSATSIDRPTLTVFSLDTGITFTLKSNEHLYPIEPSSLKQYPPLAVEIILCNTYPLDSMTMTFTPFTIDTLRSLTLNEVLMGRIKLATRSCFWIDPLVKPVRLTALKRIAYDKPIRKQLIASKLAQSNDNHMNTLEKLAVEANLVDAPAPDNEPVKEQSVPVTKTAEQESPKEEVVDDSSLTFKPFLNRIGQLIINPVGRSKQFFSKHNQQFRSDFVKPVSSTEGEQSQVKATDRYMPLGRGHRPQSIPASNSVHLEEHSSLQTLENTVPLSMNSTVTTPSEIGTNKMAEMETKKEDISEDAIPNGETSEHPPPPEASNEDDQMMFIFGPKLFSQLRQIKDMEDEQRRQADFPVQRNRSRYPRNNNNNTHYMNTNSKASHPEQIDDEQNDSTEQHTPAPDMSRYEPFVDERGPLTQTQIDYRQSQRKTRLFWEQTSQDIYLTIGFYNVDSTQTRVEFDTNFIYCRTRIRAYDRFVRIHLASEIVPEKCLFQVRRSNILVTIRKANVGTMWTTLTNRPVEPRPDFFKIEYGSDDESDAEKRRRTVNRQWDQIREDKQKSKATNDSDKFLIDDIDEDELPPTDKLDQIHVEEKNQQELTDTSSDCHSTDSDDCYYEDQVPANHIPRGYDEADYDHRFYGQHIRT